jgi:hypothetical protein
MKKRFSLFVALAIGLASLTNAARAQDFDIFGEPPAVAVDPAVKAAPEVAAETQKNLEVFGNAPDNIAETKAVTQRLPSPSFLNSLFSHQWVRTDDQGAIRGSVVSLVGQDSLSVSGARVTMAQQGKSAMTVDTNVDGNFSFAKVPAGVYSLIVEADNSFATFGVAVVANDLGQHLPNDIEVRVVRPKSLSLAEIIQREMVPSPSETRTDLILRDPIAGKRVFASSHRVAAGKDGTVQGQLSKIAVAPGTINLAGMRAFLLKEGKTIESVPVSNDGSFSFSGVQPGCYGFLAAGRQGIAAVSFCVVNDSTVAKSVNEDGSRFVAFAQDSPASGLNVELADGADFMGSAPPSSVEEVIPGDEVTADGQPMMAAGGGFPGGGFPGSGGGGVYGGGGGGGGYGGLIGGLAAAGLIAWGISESGSDTNNNAPVIVSPIQ